MDKKQILKTVKETPETSVVAALVIMGIILSLLSDVFFTVGNFVNILQQVSVTAIVAIGQALIIITGNIDLSAGSTMALGGVTAAFLTQLGLNPWAAALIAVIIGCGIGYIIGFMTVKLQIVAFIVTLGMDYILRGCCYLITDGMPISYMNAAAVLGSGKIGIVPISIFIMLVLIIVFQIFTKKTVTGRYFFAVGCNVNSARMSGIRVDRIQIGAYIAMGALASFAGIINAGNLWTADAVSGQTLGLDTIAASTIGGVSMSGGSGSIIGVLLGAIIIGTMKNAFVLLNISAYWQRVAIGLIIILAVGLDRLRAK